MNVYILFRSIVVYVGIVDTYLTNSASRCTHGSEFMEESGRTINTFKVAHIGLTNRYRVNDRTPSCIGEDEPQAVLRTSVAHR